MKLLHFTAVESRADDAFVQCRKVQILKPGASGILNAHVAGMLPCPTDATLPPRTVFVSSWV